MSIKVIVILAIVAIHVVGAIMKATAARKAREQKRLATERARLASPRNAPPTTASSTMEPTFGGSQEANRSMSEPQPLPLPTPSSQTTPVPAPVKTGRPLDDLAARRKAQIEQLRLRRESQRAGAPAQARRGSVPQSSTSTRTMQPTPITTDMRRKAPEAVPTRQIQTEQREREERAKRERQVLSAKNEAEANAARKRQSQAKARAADVEKRMPKAILVDTAATTSASDMSAIQTVARDSLRKRLMNRNAIRQAFILNELLNRPIGDRQPLV